MNLDGPTLLQLLPAIYRLRDADQGGVLGTLMGVFAEQVQVLQEDLAQLYDDQFIETCADWVVPYIGDLIGYRQLHGVAPAISSPRAEVANTIHLRRGKGTVAVLESLARDVTGWDAHVAEYFLGLAATQYMKHVRAGRGGTVDLRQQPVLERIGSPFDSAAHTAAMRAIGDSGGRYNIANVGIHLWQLGSAGLTRATAFGLDAQRFFFNPLGADLPLFSRPLPLPGDAPLATEANLPLPISRRGLNANMAGFFGTDGAAFIEGLPDGTTVLAADLSDLDAAGTKWAHVPAAGSVLLDPERGRIAFAEAQAAAPRVSFRYGSAADLGGGEYERLATLNLTLPATVVQPVAGGVQAALDASAAGGAVELPDSGTYVETPAIALAADAVVELRSADQARAVLQMSGELAISGADGSELTLNGLVISGGALHVKPTADGQQLRTLRFVHCTLVPGLALLPNGAAASPGVPSLIVETEGTEVLLDHCIVGGLRVNALSTLTLTGCIVDAGDPAAVALAAVDGAGPAAPLTASESTLVGRVHTAALDAASNCIFHAALAAGVDAGVDAAPWPAAVWSERRQQGCVRFCYLPLGSLVPRCYRCQPAQAADTTRVVPMFTSLRYGDAAYAQLSRRTAAEIRAGADDGAEMGAYHEQQAQQRESNLRLRLGEYLRVGLDGGLLFAD